MGDQVWQELRLELCQGGRRLSLVLGRMAFGRRLGVLRTCGSNQIWGCLRWRLCNEGAEVLDTAFTVNGQDCVGQCATQGENYWWCYKSPKFVTHNGKNPVKDADWDYCSPNPQNTRYNKPCSDTCESRGETYYWCNTGSTWDYCSPAVETVEKLLGDGGGQCVGKCDALNEDYTWCPVINVGGEGLSTSPSKVWWDYC